MTALTPNSAGVRLPSTAAPRRAGAAEDRNFGLDVARFTAVSLVLVTHCSVMFLSLTRSTPPIVVQMCSFLGVELFFVLSGFLIGRLLFRIVEADPTPHGWLTFMSRRWLRTLPLYFVWLAVLPSVLPAPDAFGAHLLRYATMTQNLAWPMPADHWFNESWSLAVEEWFYLLFSAALLGAVALTRGSRAIWPVIGAFIVIPAVLRAFRPAHDDFEQQIYHIVLFRLDAIAYGVALARLYQQGSRLFRHQRLAGAAGGALIAAVWLLAAVGSWPQAQVPFQHLQLFAVSIGLCLLLTAALGLRPAWAPLTWVVRTGARISYGIYIMHLTIIATVAWAAARNGLGVGFVVPVSLALIAVLPYLSHRFFEAPLLALRPGQAHPAAIAARAGPGAAAPDLPVLLRRADAARP